MAGQSRLLDFGLSSSLPPYNDGKGFFRVKMDEWNSSLLYNQG
jgi:hypothetical protein